MAADRLGANALSVSRIEWACYLIPTALTRGLSTQVLTPGRNPQAFTLGLNPQVLTPGFNPKS